MTLTPRQIREHKTNAKSCTHHVVLYSCDDVGYPSGWVEKWTCLACGLEDSHSTGGSGKCLGEFGNCDFSKAVVIIDNESLQGYYDKFEDLFKKLQAVPKEEWRGNVAISFRKRNKKIERASINTVTTSREVEAIVSRIKKVLGY